MIAWSSNDQNIIHNSIDEDNNHQHFYHWSIFLCKILDQRDESDEIDRSTTAQDEKKQEL